MVTVVIEPYEPLIAKAVELIQSKEPGYFQGISKIVVEPSDTGHFGRVESDKPDVIYVSIGRLRNALSAQEEEAQVLEAALTLAHEMGHLKSQFQGGEAPAESEESRMAQVLTSELHITMRACRYEYNLSRRKASQILKSAQYDYVSSAEIASAILLVIGYFVQKVHRDRKQDYINKFRMKLQAIDTLGLSSKNNNPNGGLGASISLIKNLLMGKNQATIAEALSIVYQGLSRL